MSAGRGALVVIAVVVALFAAACGVRTDDSPRAIEAEDVPFGLLEPSTTQAPTTTTAPPLLRFEVFFVREGRLAPVPAESETLFGAINELRSGPTDAQGAEGFRTSIPPDVDIAGFRQEGDTAVFELMGPFDEAGSNEQILALAQMVFTATGFEGVSRARFLLDGETVEIPRADGTLTTEPVTRSDYATLL